MSEPKDISKIQDPMVLDSYNALLRATAPGSSTKPGPDSIGTGNVASAITGTIHRCVTGISPSCASLAVASAGCMMIRASICCWKRLPA